MLRTGLILWLSALTITLFAQQGTESDPYLLEPTPTTVAWGHYWSEYPPVLKIRSGDFVKIHTLLTSNPERLEAAGVPADQVEKQLRDVQAMKDKGPGGHVLTGPIYIEGADSGDILEVRLRSIDLAIPYGYNAIGAAGFLSDEIFDRKMRIIPLDAKKMIGHWSDGIDIPLHPFFGSLGVAPPKEAGRWNSAPPWIHGGNLDNKELVAGTTIYYPVFVKGALFEIGDGHAAQGNGEVDITALETSLHGSLQFVVRKDLHLRWPRAETPTHFIAMGMDKDLTEAMKIAVREAIEFLTSEKKLSRDDAYMLCSVAVDFNVTQVVDGTKGVHAMIPKGV
ncbi:MAG TPA: acetamidase/formamidase family protein, partial [Puia sp.]|nr:acetamidase/formamidase family protein [Puia sp.]